MNVLAGNARARLSISTAVIFSLLALPLLGLGNPGASQVKGGNRLYGEKKYDEAIRQYQQGLTILPDSPAIRFNIGAAEYRKNAYDRSGALFNQVLQAGDESLAAPAAYNLGNTLFREGKLLEALAAFKKAIELDPQDLDAKFNYEFVLRKIEKPPPTPPPPPPPPKPPDEPPPYLYQSADDAE